MVSFKELLNDKIIHLILRDFVELPHLPFESVRVSRSRISSPPGWLVASLMNYVMGFKIHDNEDKSYWQVHVKFHSLDLRIRDWKGSTWSVDVFGSPSPTEQETVDSLISKLEAACKRYEKHVLKHMWASQLEADEFKIQNTFQISYSHYMYLRELHDKGVISVKSMMENVEAPEDLDIRGIISKSLESAARVNLIQTNSKILYNASILFFYATTENIFDIGFMFLNHRKVNYRTFRSLDWKERFKISLPGFLDKNQKIYDALYRGLKDQRHQIAHGFGGEESGLFYVPGMGHYPVSYDSRKRKPFSSLKIRDQQKSSEDVFETEGNLYEVFDAFENALRSDPWGYCLMRFAQSALNIPLSLKASEDIRKRIDDPEEFERWMEYREDQMERAINGEL